MRIIAVDPGTSNTGVVYMDESRIIDAATFHYAEKVRHDQQKLWMRARDIGVKLGWLTAKWPHDLIVMEGYVTYSGRQGGYTFQTPYLVGYLHRQLEGESIEIQTSRQVLNHRTKGSAVEKGESKRQAIARWGWANSGILKNEHVRSAALHGIYYFNHREG